MIKVSQPFLNEIETNNILDALSTGAISGFFGTYITKFENDFAKFCGVEHGIAVTSGTTALHLAMIVLDIKEGDEVIVPTYTNMASFFAVMYQGATPVAVDIEKDTWNMDVSKIEPLINKNTKAIMPVHIFGHSVDMDPLLELARKYNLAVVEDCAQAHGAEYKGRRVGSMGDIGCFSFYANKIITTGEGGMLVTNNAEYAERAKSVKCLAFGDKNKFMHKELGYNYRMTNLQAAIGCAQLNKIDEIIQRKRMIASWYTELLKGSDLLTLPVEREGYKNMYWMYHIVLSEKCSLSRAEVMDQLHKQGVETREGFVPYNQQEALVVDCSAAGFEVANYIGAQSFYLPSGPELTRDDVETVCKKLLTIIS